MSKIMKAYAERTGHPIEALRFLFDGERIKDDDTPKMLELEDEDQINAVLTQSGGGDGKFLNLKVKDQVRTNFIDGPLVSTTPPPDGPPHSPVIATRMEVKPFSRLNKTEKWTNYLMPTPLKEG